MTKLFFFFIFQIAVADEGVLSATTAPGSTESSSEPPKRHAAQLTRNTLQNNVLDAASRSAEHFVVKYCVPWYAPCSGAFDDFFQVQAEELERTYNQDAVLVRKLRFAEVDCASDKVLCNEMFVDDYPTIVHYHRGKVVSKWTSSSKTMEKRIDKLLEWLRKVVSFDQSNGRDEPSQLYEEMKEAFSLMRSFVGAAAILVAASSFARSQYRVLCAAASDAVAKDSSCVKDLVKEEQEQLCSDGVRYFPREWTTEKQSIDL